MSDSEMNPNQPRLDHKEHAKRMLPSSSDAAPRLMEPLQIKDAPVKTEEASLNYKCYMFASFGSLMLGSKMMLLTVTQMNEYWIFFIEHMAIWMTCCVAIILYLNTTWDRDSAVNIQFKMVHDYRQ